MLSANKLLPVQTKYREKYEFSKTGSIKKTLKPVKAKKQIDLNTAYRNFIQPIHISFLKTAA
jgi:hypothetical protein